MLENEEKKISIIIPVFNGELYIKKCIESTLNQSYRNIEIIIINDGSYDKTLDIINYYAKKNKNIYVINKKNEGVSIARNEGIKKSKGDYILFLDSDDTLESNALELLLGFVLSKEVDLVIGSNNILRRKKIIRKNVLNDKLYSKQEIIEEITIENKLLGTPWGKLFNTNIIKTNNIMFDSKLGIAEDTLFNLNYLVYTKKVYVCSNIVYNYVLGGLASSSKFHANIYYSYYLLLLMYIKINENQNVNLILKRAEQFLKIIIDHYCVFCSKKNAVNNIKKTFELFNELNNFNIYFENRSLKKYDNIKEINKVYKNYFLRNYFHIKYRRLLVKLRQIIRF